MISQNKCILITNRSSRFKVLILCRRINCTLLGRFYDNIDDDDDDDVGDGSGDDDDDDDDSNDNVNSSTSDDQHEVLYNTLVRK